MKLFWKQFSTLVWKNWIVLSRHPISNVIRCVSLPIIYGLYTSVVQTLLIRSNNNGIGDPIPIFNLTSAFDGSLTLIWADGTTSPSSPTPSQIISHITTGWSPRQLAAVKQVATPDDIPDSCPQNFILLSECFAAVAFNSIPDTPGVVNYTIRGDRGMGFVDVIRHKSDFEKVVLPLQWAIDKAIIELRTGQEVPTPLQWPYTQTTNEEAAEQRRLDFVKALSNVISLALFIGYLGIVYHLPGAVATERSQGLTSHMRAMGLLDSARMLSWIVSYGLAYLPAWLIVASLWHTYIFKATSSGLILLIHLLFPLLMTSHSLFISIPFSHSPSLAAAMSIFLNILWAIMGLTLKNVKTGAAVLIGLVFPGSWYIFVVRALSGWERDGVGASAAKRDPVYGLNIGALLISAVVGIVLWPYLAVLLERKLFEVPKPTSSSSSCFSRKKREVQPPPEGIAISIRSLKKVFKSHSWFSRKGDVTAVTDLSLDIPENGIYVLLGSNGAGKSTTLSILSSLIAPTSGTITFSNGLSHPPRGTIGVVPQKNVLFNELTCLQTMKVWQAIKFSSHSSGTEDLSGLLEQCDLKEKTKERAGTLSGGQKRKLQLAIGLVGGSKIVLVDECTSGVDPLSRRALWRTLTGVKHDRTIIFTTHFLDEADLLADNIAILATPGKLVASGTPVALKRDLGEGYVIQATFNPPPGLDNNPKLWSGPPDALLTAIQAHAPATYTTHGSAPFQTLYRLKSRDPAVVKNVLRVLENGMQAFGVERYDILGTTIEEIFLDLMEKNEVLSVDERAAGIEAANAELLSLDQLPTGHPISPIRQALTIMYKRFLILRRSFITPIVMVLIAILGSTVPLKFIKDAEPSCERHFANSTKVPLWLPVSPIVGNARPSAPFGGVSDEPAVPKGFLVSPPGLFDFALGNTTRALNTTSVPDNATFVDTFKRDFKTLDVGGISFDAATGNSLVAWVALTKDGGLDGNLAGPALVNTVSNLLFTRALNATAGGGGAAGAVGETRIQPTYHPFPFSWVGTFTFLEWLVFYGAAMAVYPAFFAMYVTRERKSSIQALQMSNGLTNPLGLWLGHLAFDTVFSVFIATVVTIVFAVATPDQFYGLGYLWFIMVLYGIASALFAYCASLIFATPLAAFAAVAAYQIVAFLLYLSSYFFVLTYALPVDTSRLITIIHFSMSIASPAASLTRAALISVNLFSLLCTGETVTPTSQMGTITHFGGPILYLFITSFILLFILVRVDSGSLILRHINALRRKPPVKENDAEMKPIKQDVVNETKQVEASEDLLLRVLHVSKSFGKKRVVEDVSLGVGKGTVMALLGPNGAGKTTTFNVIRGDILPDSGTVLINGTSVLTNPRVARHGLGVCPQFTAIDTQLTVREHLIIYGRLKGLAPGAELEGSVDAVMRATNLRVYKDRLASKLSGGNQRKLSLAIALMGNPPVILIDEFSTGIDAKMKREMWRTLRNVAHGKAVVITTHSMEEASALASKVGILAKRLLAIGTTSSLSSRYPTYEVHFSCRTPDEINHAQALMQRIPNSRRADDVATRFEVPINDAHQPLSLAQLFDVLSTHGGFSEYAVERATLESVFIKVIRENDVKEEDKEKKKKWWKCW